MTTQQSLFPTTGQETVAQAAAERAEIEARRNAAEGERRRRIGMQAAATKATDALGYARELACDLAREKPNRCITADDVALALEAEGRPGLGNAAGSLFTVGPWTFTGEWIESVRPNAHRNRLRVWRYGG